MSKEQGGLFKGMPLQDMLARASHLPLRAGWSDFAQWLVMQPQVETHIISIGWSAVFMRHLLEQPPSSLPRDCLKSLNSNEVDMNSNSKGTGSIVHSRDAPHLMLTGSHKLAVLKLLKSRQSKHVKTVYVGDSKTDLPSLLAADVGIIMGPACSLKETCKRFNITISHCSDYLAPLVAAADWHEALSFLQDVVASRVA